MQDQYYRMLLESIQLLASDYETQVRSLPDYVHVPDEIALTYYDCLLLLEQIEEAGLVTEEQVYRMKAVDMLLSSISGQENAHLWTRDALKNDQVWEQVRNGARQILDILGERQQPPNLFWIQYAGEASGSEE